MKATIGKKAVQRQRKMRHFIDAAEQIIFQHGEESLTIRKVADIANYNSATIYNYFENLEHLVYYTYVRHIRKFEKKLAVPMDTEMTECEYVQKLWFNFCELAFDYPEIVYTLLYSSYSARFKAILDDCSAIYSDGYDEKSDVWKVETTADSLLHGIFTAIQLFGDSQSLSKAEIEELQRIISTYLQGALIRQTGYEKVHERDEYMEQMMNFIDRIMCVYAVEMDSCMSKGA